MYYISQYFLEIRWRCMYIVWAFLCSFFTSYVYKYELFFIFCKPFLIFHTKFLFFELTEGLSTMIRIATLSSLCAIFPFILYQFWSFYIPSVYQSERDQYNTFFSFFLLCLLIEFYFVYSFLFPKICEFFMGFEIHSLDLPNVPTIECTPRIIGYVGYTVWIFAFFLFLFQLPFLAVIVFSKKVYSCYLLCDQRKGILFLCIFFSAFICPPDFLSQLLFTLSFYSTYECIIFLGFLYEPLKE